MPVLAFACWTGFPATASGQRQAAEAGARVGSFNGVALNVPGNVELRIGNTDSVTIEADDNILPLIDTAVENGTLRIRPAGAMPTSARPA
jgi:hypothetical protein